MKKIIICAIVATGCAAVGIPFTAGMKAETVFNDNIPIIKEQAENMGLRLEQSQFDRGLFFSNANITFTQKNALANQKPVIIKWQSTIQNGPLLSTDSGTSIGVYATDSTFSLENLPQEIRQITSDSFGKNIASEQSILGFGGQLTGTIAITPINIKDDEGTLSFEGAQTTYRSNTDFNNIIAELNVKPFAFKAKDTDLTIAPFNTTFDLNRTEGDTYIGDISMLMPLVTLKSGITRVELNNFSFDLKSSLNNNKIDISETIAIEEIKAPIPLQSASYSIAVNQMDTKALAAWRDITQSIQNGTPTDELSKEQIRQLISVVLQKGLQFNQELKIKAMGQDNLAKIDVTFVGTKNNQHIMDLDNPMDALSAANANIKIQAAELGLMMTPMAPQIESMINQGLIKKQDGLLIFTAKLEDGKVSVAEKPFPLGMLFGGNL